MDKRALALPLADPLAMRAIRGLCGDSHTQRWALPGMTGRGAPAELRSIISACLTDPNVGSASARARDQFPRATTLESVGSLGDPTRVS
jgi:hypothetical protein